MPLNQLKLNNGKTEFLFLSSKFGNKHNAPTIRIGADDIPSSSTARNLGVLFDDGLTLCPHINSVCKMAYFQIHRISRIRKFLTSPAVKTIVHSLVASRLDYCNGVLASLPDHLIKKLQSVQNSAARLISQVKKHDHITLVLKDLHWLPVCQRILFKILVVTCKAPHGLAPKYISDLVEPYVPSRSLGSSTKQLLVVPKHKTQSYGARAFSIFAPAEYNKLPQYVTTALTVACFKSRLKTHLFIAVFD